MEIIGAPLVVIISSKSFAFRCPDKRKDKFEVRITASKKILKKIVRPILKLNFILKKNKQYVDNNK